MPIDALAKHINSHFRLRELTADRGRVALGTSHYTTKAHTDHLKALCEKHGFGLEPGREGFLITATPSTNGQFRKLVEKLDELHHRTFR